MSDQIVLLGAHWNSIQRYLIPELEDEVDELDEPQRAFVEICELQGKCEQWKGYKLHITS